MYAPNAKPKPSIQKQRIFPTWDQIDTLRTPLIEGERTLAQFLDDNLPSEWEIYLQPFMNGDHPDIVILHPNVGLMIYEVKDWNLAHYERRRENDGDRCYVRDARGWHAIADPRRQVERYRENLAYLYAPYIGKEISDNRKTLGALPTGLYFHRATTAQAQAFVPSGRGGCTVIGHDALTPNNLKNVVPGVKYTTSGVFYSYWVDTPFSGIRAWLRPPFHVMEQSEPLGLTEEQKRHVSPSPGQHQRLRGVAGSGKTLVLAQRAANLAAAGKHVLVVTFNITLWHYIRDMVSRARVGFEWDRIEFTHFHGLCRNFLDENDEPWPSSDAVDTETLLNEIVPGLVIKMLQEGRNRKKLSEKFKNELNGVT